jgi:hypothetical protein
MSLTKSRPRIIETPAELDSPAACIVCGGSHDFTGVFVPRRSSGSDEGSYGSRAITYCLCEFCQSQPDWPSMVEERIFGLKSVPGSKVH